jgi:hypothetical protein
MHWRWQQRQWSFRDASTSCRDVSLAFLVVMTNFIERSSDLRVDSVAAALGLLSLLCLVSRRGEFSRHTKGCLVAASVIALITLCVRDRASRTLSRRL